LLNAHYLPGLTSGAYTPLDPLADEHERCIEDSIHDAVRGNPCARNRKRALKTPPARLPGLLKAAKGSKTRAAHGGSRGVRPD
jgi:hypothetical protein